jgi:hypothetical protein
MLTARIRIPAELRVLRPSYPTCNGKILKRPSVWNIANNTTAEDYYTTLTDVTDVKTKPCEEGGTAR